MGFKTKKDEIEKIIIDVPSEFKKIFKMKCKKNRMTMKRVLVNLIDQYIEGKTKVKLKST